MVEIKSITSKINKIFLLLIIIGVIAFVFTLPKSSDSTSREEVIVKAKVIELVGEKKIGFDNLNSVVQTYKAKITSGDRKEEIIEVSSAAVPESLSRKTRIGDNILLGIQKGSEDTYYFIDYDRTLPLLLISTLFVLAAVAVVGLKGIKSLLSMLFSFLGIFTVVLPLISKGYNPLIISISSLTILIPAIFFLTHGINKKTFVSIISVVVSFLITFGLVYFFIETSVITGLFIQDLSLLIMSTSDPINVPAILISGIIIGVLGALDDITVTQASIVEQIAKEKMRDKKDIFIKAMIVGKDHLASIINTLIFVYTGASLPLLLLFYKFERPGIIYLTSETVTLAIITALSVTIGLIIAMPITTFIAINIFTRNSPYPSEEIK